MSRAESVKTEASPARWRVGAAKLPISSIVGEITLSAALPSPTQAPFQSPSVKQLEPDAS